MRETPSGTQGTSFSSLSTEVLFYSPKILFYERGAREKNKKLKFFGRVLNGKNMYYFEDGNEINCLYRYTLNSLIFFTVFFLVIHRDMKKKKKKKKKKHVYVNTLRNINKPLWGRSYEITDVQ